MDGDLPDHRCGATTDGPSAGPYSGHPVPWDGKTIGGWTIWMHRLAKADLNGYNYQGSATQGDVEPDPKPIKLSACGRPIGFGRVGTQFAGDNEKNVKGAKTLFADEHGSAQFTSTNSCIRTVGDPDVAARLATTGSSCAPDARPPTAGPRPVQAVNTVFALDISGSMKEPTAGDTVSKLEAAKRSAGTVLSFIEQENASGAGETAGLVAFDDTVRQVNAPTIDFATLRQTLDALQPGGQTDIFGGLNKAIELTGQGTPGSRRIVILLTDGLQNAPERSTQEFLDGPVKLAHAGQVTLCTIGLGRAGEFDEALLKQIPTQCEYHAAGSESALHQVYLRTRAASLGTVLQEFTGGVAQGETAQAGSFALPAGVGQLNISDTWPGSKLALHITDPAGRSVVAGYPGAAIGTTDTAQNVLIDAPKVGQWRVQIVGENVTQPQEPFYVVVSTRPSAPTPPPMNPPPTRPALTGSAGGGAASVVTTLALAGAVFGMVVFVLVQRRAYRFGGSAGASSTTVVLAGPHGTRLALTEGAYLLGRESDCGVRLNDRVVSRHHARLIIDQRGAGIEDLGSATGTFVNGILMDRAALHSGDAIRIGSTDLFILTERV